MDTYTHGHAEPVLQSHRWRTVENSAAYLVPLLRPGADLLDVGCGPGTITVDLAACVAPGRVLGIDVSVDPLTEARAAAERAGVEVTFAVDDVYALDPPVDFFDVVHAHQVLQHLRLATPEELDAIADAWRGWRDADDGWLGMMHGELLIRV